ncbi:AMMECR1 protein, partial [Ostertagia ostertagi]
MTGGTASVEMAVFCFDVIAAAVNNHSDPPVPPSIPNDKFLHTGLRDYAITSAFHDSRFDPVRKEEIPHLHCGVSVVSLLIKFESAHDYMDWTIGMHGIRIHFMDGSVRRDAVYLPEVAYEQGWDHLETINNLIEKGGYRGRIDEGFRLSLQVTRFQSSKIMISYDVSSILFVLM